MYFILGGSVGIGYSLISNGVTKKPYKRAKKLRAPCLICDHYVVNNAKSQFVYLVVKDIKCFALTKKFLTKSVFPRHPDIASSIKAESLLRYKRHIQKPIHEHRIKELEEMNKRNPYLRIHIEEKSKNQQDSSL